MDSHLKFLTPFALAIGLWLGVGVVYAQTLSVGLVTQVLGQVFIHRADQPIPAKVGMSLIAGDRVQTGSGAHLYARMVDQAFLSVRADSSVRLTQYAVDLRRPSDQAIRLDLDGGAVRYITGDGAKAARDRFRLNTPVAAVGVRGTDLTVYSTAEVTRLSVASGAVVIAPLDDNCRATALGPCDGPHALLLTAQDQFAAEVRIRAASPILLPSGDAAPDKFSPPAPNEGTKALAPSVQVGAGAPPAPPASPSVVAVAQPQVTPAPAVSLSAAASAASVSSAPAASLPAAVSNPPPASRPMDAPSVSWGRWGVLNQTISSDAADSTLSAFLQGREAAMLIGPYGVARRQGDMPTELPKGMVSFSLADQHASVLHRASGNAVGEATVTSGSLLINFDTNAFLTKLSLNGGSFGMAQLNATGRIAFDGRFQSDSLVSEGTVAGLLAGPKAQEAGYVFERQLPGGLHSIVGATRWTR